MSTSGRVARNAAIQSAAETISKIAALVLYAVLARALGQEGFGEFSFAFSLATLLIVLAAPGVNDIMTREIARDRGQLGRLLWNGLGLRAGLGLVAVTVAVAFALVGNYSAEARVAVLLLGLTMLAEAFSKALHAVFVAHDDMRPVATSLLLQRLSTAGAGVAAAAADLGLVVICAVFLAGALLGLAYSVWRLRRDVEIPAAQVSAADSRWLLTTALPLGINAIFTAVLFRVDTVILSLLESEAAVGLYGATYRLLDATLFLTYSLGTAMLPVLSRLGPKTVPTVGEAYTSAAKVLTVILFPIGATCALFAEPIMRLVYGSEFTGGATALRLLGGTMALYGIPYLAAVTLAAQDRQKWIPLVSGPAALLNIGLNLVLIPQFSLDGAAAATTATELARAFVLVLLLRRLAGGFDALRVLAGPLAGCLGMLAVWLALGEHLLVIPVAAAAYMAVLLAYERLRHPGDVRLIAGALARRKPPLSGA